MANEPKKRSITGKLVANVLTEREDDFTCNVTYVAKLYQRPLPDKGSQREQVHCCRV